MKDEVNMPREQVEWFAEQMESKLQENDSKGGWDNCNLYWLVSRIYDEVKELTRAIDVNLDFGDNQKDIISESADVANFVMMIADIAKKQNK